MWLCHLNANIIGRFHPGSSSLIIASRGASDEKAETSQQGGEPRARNAPNGVGAGGQRVNDEEGAPSRSWRWSPIRLRQQPRRLGQQAVNEDHLFTQAAFTFVQSPAHFLSEVSAHTKHRERERDAHKKEKKNEDEESCGNV